MVSAERQHLTFRLPSSRCGRVVCLRAAWSLRLHINEELNRRILEPWTCFIIFVGYLHITAMCSKAYIVYTCTQKARAQDKLSYAKILENFCLYSGYKIPMDTRLRV
jgi:hypothetical protein